jgi:hypothetical protein
MYHYKVRLSQGQDPGVFNNLGVAYEALKLPGKEVESFSQAAPDHGLAKANLSTAYVERGFLSTAEELASAVLALDQAESVGRDRAARVLQDVTSTRTEEAKKEERIVQDARREADFRASYADAYLDATATPFTGGQFDTPHGQLTLRQDGDRLTGVATIREPALSLLISLGPDTAAREQTRVLNLQGSVHQRAGSFTLTTEVTPDGLFGTPERSKVTGLLVIASDGQSLQVLEQGKDASKIYIAPRAPLGLSV